MGEREKYLFDLQGFLLVKGFLSTAEVKALNESLDANLDKRGEYGKPNVLSGQWQGRPLEGQFSPFRHYSGMLTWQPPWCQPFRDLLAHPKLIPYLNTLMGRGWKLDHGVDVLNSTAGCEGLKLHGSGNMTFNGLPLLRLPKRDNALWANRLSIFLDRCEFRRWWSMRDTRQPQSKFLMSRRYSDVGSRRGRCLSYSPLGGRFGNL